MFSLMLDGENLTRAHPISTLEGEKFKWARCGERIDKNPDLFCHWTADATLANTEEWAILKAATFAGKSGISLFSISNRIDIKHSVIYSANYMPTGPIHQGYSTQLSISAGTEDQSNNNCWRCISPTDVEDSLKPIYIRESGTR
jgi:hypothetical protein